MSVEVKFASGRTVTATLIGNRRDSVIVKFNGNVFTVPRKALLS